jgi:hypothetical protein
MPLLLSLAKIPWPGILAPSAACIGGLGIDRTRTRRFIEGGGLPKPGSSHAPSAGRLLEGVAAARAGRVTQ